MNWNEVSIHTIPNSYPDSATPLNQWIEMRKTETALTVLQDVQRFCKSHLGWEENITLQGKRKKKSAVIF